MNPKIEEMTDCTATTGHRSDVEIAWMDGYKSGRDRKIENARAFAGIMSLPQTKGQDKE